ncbi:acyl-CoA thioesterase [Halostella sp. JP-L12]|uniref:acyl-CoA thioesterase n=1 Tax=Halostella TaxID=1843185 RepID=UPI000EF80EE7|nr:MULTISPECIES: thioesterase family protein [Halostella]NHN49886.1 acyl-CoA thioesterase [Halostella sp. JP-L12]
MDEFSYATDVNVRVRDIDFMGHVNNAVYATYLEVARTSYFEDVLDVPLTDIDSVLAHLEIDYRRPITAKDDVTVALRVPRIGESSLPMEYEIRAGEEVAATAQTVQVTVDRGTGETRPISDRVRASIAEFEGLD